MPFELGLLLGWQMTKKPRHTWVVFESVRRRLPKSLSDLDGRLVKLAADYAEPTIPRT